jgi:hypothetical protein
MIEIHGEVDQKSFSNIFKGSQISEVFKSSQISKTEEKNYFDIERG